MNATRPRRFLPFLLPLLLAVAIPALAQDDEDDDFTPRTDAPPARRTGGASRDVHFEGPSVSVLAPATSTGLTGRPQPVIYWSLSEATEFPVAVTINNNKDKADPVLETVLEGPKKGGIHKLDVAKVADAGKLEPGVPYEVVIEVVRDENNASKNATASARLELVGPDAVPAEAKKEKDPAKLAAVYGRAGLWFDYLDALNAAIQANPKDKALIDRRAKALAAQRLVWKADGTIVEERAAGGAGGGARGGQK